MEIKPTAFGILDGKVIHSYTITNNRGLSLSAIPYGGIIQSLNVPDTSGKAVDVVLGFDTFDEYLDNSPYFGALIGRYGNRIAKGSFTLEGKTYQLEQNDGTNSLHGGSGGFNTRIWEVNTFDTNSITMSYISQNGEEGFPGTLTTQVSYTLTEENDLVIEYKATTDKTTHCCLTQHSYFNLNGKGSVLNHRISLAADSYTPSDSNSIPTGEIASVEGTVFDLRKEKILGEAIKIQPELLSNGGFDHNFVLPDSSELKSIARVTSPESGIQMETLTTEPGVQFYTANYLEGSKRGKNGVSYQKHAGFCLEAQHYPDSPNKANFPSTVLKPGDEYRQTTVYRFSTLK